jgi:hypothetical protein
LLQNADPFLLRRADAEAATANPKASLSVGSYQMHNYPGEIKTALQQR